MSIGWVRERKKKNGEENGRGGSMGRLPLLYVHSPAPSPEPPSSPALPPQVRPLPNETIRHLASTP